ncbi:hypothetical protein A3J41_02375 [candidate division TM6 bacterium RIFCSPHIGHO2_12_FULL_38_8]|nr:MAG: hypothetical protein A3J41_02375 [candidate division TM6 bacterium RIFCSPHIGHO2_12_FULL_38_8]
MIQSMTGFASKIVEIPLSKTEKLSLSLHLKTLNSRYFEATCKLPYLLSHCEVAIQRILKRTLDRGHVYLFVKVQHDATRHVVIPSKTTILQYLQAIHQIQNICKIKEPVTLASLLALPNIFQIEEETVSGTAEEKVLQAIEILAEELIATRVSEGKVLEQDIALHIKAVMKKLELVDKASLKVSKEKKESLNLLISKLQTKDTEQISVEQCMLENQKVTLLAELEKIDIHEEIVRAHAHAKNIISMLKDKNVAKGKKLDFTLQELNREINTIASKCSHAQISSLTIDMKTDVEKAREQAQNIL